MTAPVPADEASLEAALSAPDRATVRALGALDGDILVLGAGGKMGPSLATMARQAIPDHARRVIAVSRFSDARVAAHLEASGVIVHRADLGDPAQLRALPDAANVIWMAGQKFGTTGDPTGTWRQNVVASVHAAERYAGSRIVCFSTGNVYGRSLVADGGSREDAPLVPDGEYAASCIGRERVFQAIAQRTGSPLLLYRLFYANDLRYGVVTEIARRVLAGEPVDVTTGHVNVIWQGDANRLALRALTVAPPPRAPINDSDPLKTAAGGPINDSDPLKTAAGGPLNDSDPLKMPPATPINDSDPLIGAVIGGESPALNVTGPIVPVREIAERCAAHAGLRARFTGVESPTALVANVERLERILPYDALPLDALCAWAVAWIRGNGRLLAKPTKFEVRDGRF